MFCKKNEIYEAVQASYILKMRTFENFKISVNTLSSNLLETEFVGYEYSGITDLYVSEEEKPGNFLGRTSYFDYKTIERAKEFVIAENKVIDTIKTHVLHDRFNIGLVYFNYDSEGEEFYSTLIINTQLIDISGIKDLKLFAESKNFKQKIVDFSVEQLYVDDLIFIGISDFYKINDRGLFKIACDLKNINDVNKYLIKKSELKERFNEVNEDYLYVNIDNVSK